MIVREQEITVRNPLGVHGRVATRLAQLVRRYGIRLHIVHRSETIDCSSVLDVLSMAFVTGSVFKVQAAGDENAVNKALLAVEKIFAAEEEHQPGSE